MPNVTMSFDDELLKQAHMIAVEQEHLPHRDHLQALVERKKVLKELSLAELQTVFAHSEAVVGRRTWSRDDLHGRR